MISVLRTSNLRVNEGDLSIPRRGLLRRGMGKALKRALAWRYRHFVPGADAARYRQVNRLKLLVSQGVFDPSLHFTSAFFSRYLLRSQTVRGAASVLDLGTGSGVLAIAAALGGARGVVATDIDANAVRCARSNVDRFSLGGRVSVLEGDMFEPVGERQFELVVCNPPYFRGTPHKPAERAYYAGDEYEWLMRFARELPEHLTPGGRALIVLGSAADVPSVLRHLTTSALEVRQVAQRDIWIEILYIFEITRKPSSTPYATHD